MTWWAPYFWGASVSFGVFSAVGLSVGGAIAAFGAVGSLVFATFVYVDATRLEARWAREDEERNA